MRMRAIRDGYVDDRYVVAGQEFDYRGKVDLHWAIAVEKLGPPPEPPAAAGDAEQSLQVEEKGTDAPPLPSPGAATRRRKSST